MFINYKYLRYEYRININNIIMIIFYSIIGGAGQTGVEPWGSGGSIDSFEGNNYETPLPNFSSPDRYIFMCIYVCI